MPQPAYGNSMLLGLARQEFPHEPALAADLDFYRLILPAALDFNFGSNQNSEINQSGFAENGVPNAITGGMSFGARLSTRTFLRAVMSILRDVTKTTLEAGVYQYVCEWDRFIDELYWTGVFGWPPVDKQRVDDLLFQGIQFAIGNNNPINALMALRGICFSRFGTAVPDEGNTGTWMGLPFTTGPLRDKTLPYLHWEITGVSPLRFKLKQAATSTPPTMAGTNVLTQLYDSESGRALKINAQNDDGLDLGITDENWDPLLICFPGLAADHDDDIDVGDKGYLLYRDWELPTVDDYLGGQRFTSAHQLNQARKVGGSTWTDIRTLTAQLGLAATLSDDQGSGSRYPNDIDRPGLFMPTLQLASRHKSMFFKEAYEEHYPVEVRTYFQGRQLASGPYRESILFDWKGCEVKSVTRPPQNDQAIVETAQLQGNTNDAGDQALTVTVITDEDVEVPS